jgi:hypothetical protein
VELSARIAEMFDAVGCDASLGLSGTVVVSDISATTADYAADLGFSNYGEVLDAQMGRRGEDDRARASSSARIARSRVLNPLLTTRTTAGDMARLLRLAWRGEAGPPTVEGAMREFLSHQQQTRIGSRLPPGHDVWAKSGSLFGAVAE